MTNQEEILKQLTSLKGIGKVKAESIINAGFDSIEKIQQASVDELCNVNGVSESVANSIKDQLGEVKTERKTTPKEKQEKKQVVEEKKIPEQKQEKEEETMPAPEPRSKKKEEKATEEPEEYEVKKKPSLTEEDRYHLSVRKKKKKKTPHFLRQEWFRYKRIPKNWHRPDGITSKMRMNKKYRLSQAKVGFRGPKQVRGLHSSGFEEVLVHTISDLDNIDADKQAARIGSTVGTKKRVAIAEKAKELDIRLLNE